MMTVLRGNVGPEPPRIRAPRTKARGGNERIAGQASALRGPQPHAALGIGGRPVVKVEKLVPGDRTETEHVDPLIHERRKLEVRA
jgi:hypothetical protein